MNNNTQYCSIARTGFGSLSLVIGGEVDCIMGEKPDDADDPIPWVELKTSVEIGNHPRELEKFERKLCRMWAQSFLLGVPKIIIGFRTQGGYLSSIQEFETQKIPGLVARSTNVWNGNVCINMTSKFLEFLKQSIGGQEGVWRIKHARGASGIYVNKIEETGTGQILRDAFKAHREKLLATEIAHQLGRTNVVSTDDA